MTPELWLSRIALAPAQVTSLRLAPGLYPRIGDTVYMTPLGIATTKNPNASRLARAMIWCGLRHKSLLTRVGVIVDTSNYEYDQTCEVLLA